MLWFILQCYYFYRSSAKKVKTEPKKPAKAKPVKPTAAKVYIVCWQHLLLYTCLIFNLSFTSWLVVWSMFMFKDEASLSLYYIYQFFICLLLNYCCLNICKNLSSFIYCHCRVRKVNLNQPHHKRKQRLNWQEKKSRMRCGSGGKKRKRMTARNGGHWSTKGQYLLPIMFLCQIILN